MNKGFYAAFLLLFFHMAVGHLYEVRAVRKWDPAYKRHHYFIGLSDFHDKRHPANIVQRRRIEELLVAHDPKRIHVAVEDLSSSKNEALIAGSFYMNSRTGILANLGNFCKHRNIPFSNIEYRYCRVAGLGPIINNLHADPYSFPSARKVTIGMISQEINTTLQEFDIPAGAFNTMFQEKKKLIQQTMKKLKFDSASTMSVAHYISTYSTPVNRLDVIKQLLTFDGVLVGFELARIVTEHPEAEKVIGFAGGTHIAEACDILQRACGYEPVVNTQLSLFKERDLQKCLGSNIVEGGYCVKPNPISIELLEHYLKD